MRHYVPQKKGRNPLSHNLYMQMLYLIRDYAETERFVKEQSSANRQKQWDAVQRAFGRTEKAYKKRPCMTETFDVIRAFFDYPYFSVSLMQKSRDMGASKRSWNLYRCGVACLVAQELGLTENASENRRDASPSDSR